MLRQGNPISRLPRCQAGCIFQWRNRNKQFHKTIIEWNGGQQTNPFMYLRRFMLVLVLLSWLATEDGREWRDLFVSKLDLIFRGSNPFRAGIRFVDNNRRRSAQRRRDKSISPFLDRSLFSVLIGRRQGNRSATPRLLCIAHFNFLSLIFLLVEY